MHIRQRQIPMALEEAAGLYRQGAAAEAVAILRSVIKTSPRHSDALHLLGLIEMQHGNFEEAARLLKLAVKYDSGNSNYYNSLGVALRKSGRFAEAQKAYARALAIEPANLEALDNMATVLRYRDQPEEAEQRCRKALKLAPGHPKLVCNLAGALYEQGRRNEATELFESVISNPADSEYHPAARKALAEIYRNEGSATEEISQHLSLAMETKHPVAISNYLFGLNYLEDMNPAVVSAIHAGWADNLKPKDGKPAAVISFPAKDKKPLVIGYVSPDFVDHPVAWLAEPVFANHDRDSFRCIAYDVHRRGRPAKEGIRQNADIWRDARNLDDNALASLIRQDNVDILVDLAGHTGDNRLPLFARRPAPVQASWLGYINTTGLDSIDWLIADRFSIRDGEESLYTEKIWRMPAYRFCFSPKNFLAEEPSGRSDKAGITFTSNNNLLKYGNRLLAVWAEILRQLPEANLVIRWKTFRLPGVREHVADRFAAAGINSRQLSLADPVEHENLSSVFADADIALDTFPFCGGMTSLDALWMGVPVVSLASDRMAGRQTAAFLELAGHPELVADSVDEYVATAVELARNRQKLDSLRQTLRKDLLSSPLCNTVQFTRDLEAAYRGMLL